MAKQLKVVVFDLDACVWYPEMYMLWGGGQPFKKHETKKNVLVDWKHQEIKLLGESAAVWQQIKSDPRFSGVKLCVASRCDEPSWAEECLSKFTDQGGETPLLSHVDVSRIHKGSKTTHLQEIHLATGADFKDMLFFDDDPTNIEDVGGLGVTSILTPDGVTAEAWRSGLAAFGMEP